ncbi:MAG: flippase [Ignavibacteriae bacterium]|nr:flippase [Ignavibacteriota bacterium]
MLAQIVTWMSSFVLMLFLPRYLGDEAFGRLYFGISLTGLMGLMMDLGIGTLLVKEIARDHSKANLMLVNGSIIKILGWVVTLTAAMTFVFLSDYPNETITIVAVLGVAKVFEGVGDLVHRVFYGLERMEYRSISVVVEKVFLSAIGVSMLLLGFGAITIAIVMALSMLANFVTSLYLLPRLFKIRFHMERSTWRGLLVGGFPFFVSTTFSFIYYRIDIVMLSEMANDSVVGWYGAPYRLFDTLMFLPIILQVAVFPVLSRLWQSSKDSLVATARKILDITIIAGVPIAVCMVMFAQHIISILFGLEEYTNSIILLQGLAASLLLVYVDFVFATVLVSQDRQRQLSVVAIVATAINIILNYFLIPYYQTTTHNGAIGAVIATAATELAVMGMSLYLLPKGSFATSNLVIAVKAITAGLLMGLAIWLVESYFENWVAGASAGMLMYIILLFATKALHKEEVVFFFNLVSQRKSNIVPVQSK